MNEDLPAQQPASPVSLEGRPAAGLYLTGWLLSGLGLALIMLGGFPDAGMLALVGLPVLMIGLAAAAGYQVVARRRRPPAAYRGPSPLIVLGLAFLVAVIPAIGLVALGIDYTSAWGVLAVIAVQTAGYLIVGWLAVIRTGALTRTDISLPPGATAGTAGAIGLALGVMLPVTLAGLVLAGVVGSLLGVDAPEVLPTPQSAGDLLAVVLAGVILAPLGEEFFFRGLAMSAWLRDLGPRTALIRGTLLFAAVHVLNVTTSDPSTGVRQSVLVLAVILPVGYALGWLYLRRGLAASVAGHVAYNGALLLLTVLAERLAPPA